MQDPKPDRDKEGSYSNYLKVGFNAHEFLLDFGQCYEGQDPLFNVRVVATPPSVKGFAEVLNQSVTEYESRHSRIPETDDESLSPEWIPLSDSEERG